MERKKHPEKGPTDENNPPKKQEFGGSTRNDLLKAIRQRTRTHNVAKVARANDFSGLIEIRSLITSARSDPNTGVSGLITLSGIQVSPAIGPPLLLEPSDDDGASAGKILGIVTLVATGVAFVVIALTVMRGSFELPSFLGVFEPTSNAAVMPVTVDQEQGDPDLGMNNNGLAAFAVKDRTVNEKVKTDPEISSPPASSPDDVVKKKRLSKSHRRRSSARSGKHKRLEKYTHATGDEPVTKTLTRAQVNAGLRSVASRVKRCNKGDSGIVVIEVVIGKNGRVTRSLATGAYSGTSTGKCFARAVRKAKFPKFSDSRITVRYPFRL